MIKIFEDKEKVNFVDNKNVFVGFRIHRHCCEYYGWYVSTKEETTTIEDTLTAHVWDRDYTGDKVINTWQGKNLEGFVFDQKYFREIKNKTFEDGGGLVRFRLVNTKGKRLYLHLFCSHNGYYSHGFEHKINDVVVVEGEV